MALRNSSVDIGLRAVPSTAKRSGSMCLVAKAYSAGKSLRLVRSPDAPKITSTHGSGVRLRSSPSSSGFSATWVRVFLALFRSAHSVSAELVTERRLHLRSEVDLVA